MIPMGFNPDQRQEEDPSNSQPGPFIRDLTRKTRKTINLKSSGTNSTLQSRPGQQLGRGRTRSRCVAASIGAYNPLG